MRTLSEADKQTTPFLLGEAYARAMPYICEDRAWKRASLRKEVTPAMEAEFRRGFKACK